ncbi:hypothetical protein LTR56_017729 [Elasticomyces elasticus]|nr:hypothetical protein LTR56_017729 [Elasticomyces elasticus]KAK4915367.1 hypothetical protein LTR49_016498 [Elasticomyces elasticus]
MAEITGLIVGILPIFNAVLDDFHYIQIARNYKGRCDTAMIRLSNAEVRLLRWGRYVWDSDTSIDAPARRQSISDAKPTLLQLQSLLGEARAKSQQYCGAGPGDEGVAQEKLCMFNPRNYSVVVLAALSFSLTSVAVKPATERDLQVQDLCDKMKNICAEYGGMASSQSANEYNQVAPEGAKRGSMSDRFSRKVMGVKWALVDEHMFEKLVENTTALMADLEILCPAVKAVQFELGAEIEAKIRVLLAEKDEKLTDALNELKGAAREKTTVPSNVCNTWTGTNNGVQGANISIAGDYYQGRGRS